MPDIVDKATRSKMMAGIRGKSTGPEMQLRKALHARGLRYRLHAKDLPGKPDVVFRSRKLAVFVHGCFWHRHEGCKFASIPATRTDFWEEKLSANRARDKRNVDALLGSGWHVVIVWECALRPLDGPEKAAATVRHALLNNTQLQELPATTTDTA